jgi:SAM-dependent methyltransferase
LATSGSARKNSVPDSEPWDLLTICPVDRHAFRDIERIGTSITNAETLLRTHRIRLVASKLPGCCNLISIEFTEAVSHAEPKNCLSHKDCRLDSIVNRSCERTSLGRSKIEARCPRCSSSIRNLELQPLCSNADCEYAKVGFPVSAGQPVLIDFATSIFDRNLYLGNHGSALQRDVTRRSVGSRLHRFGFGKNPIAVSNCAKFIDLLKQEVKQPTVLVIGGGTIGWGTDELYSDSSIELVGTDVYASPFTTLVADAHKLPFDDGVFDGVWIQAVLEHVLDPALVVSEIHRVLRRGGAVYAETPFMQQVHERAYDFSRFTQSGHRWLFKRFSEIDAGPIGGAGVALIWSIRYFARALGAGDKLSRLISLPFFWLRFFDAIARGRAVADAASGFFFLGRRAEKAIDPHTMPKYYDLQKRSLPVAIEFRKDL